VANAGSNSVSKL